MKYGLGRCSAFSSKGTKFDSQNQQGPSELSLTAVLGVWQPLPASVVLSLSQGEPLNIETMFDIFQVTKTVSQKQNQQG